MNPFWQIKIFRESENPYSVLKVITLANASKAHINQIQKTRQIARLLKGDEWGNSFFTVAEPRNLCTFSYFGALLLEK